MLFILAWNLPLFILMAQITAPIAAAIAVLLVAVRRSISGRSIALILVGWFALSFALTAIAFVNSFSTLRLKPLAVLWPAALAVLIASVAFGWRRHTQSVPRPAKRSHTGKIVLFGVAGPIACAFVALVIAEARHFLGVIPSVIHVDYPLRIAGESGFREGCGVAIFRLSKDTQAAIQRDGVAFFDSARQARAFKDYYYSYSEWRATPAPGGATKRSALSTILLGLACSKLGRSSQDEIYRAMESPGSFYALKDEGALLVVPHKRWVIFGYWG